jgi:hypothetical protein
MNIDFAFICDYAEASGKLNALGIGFDTIYAPSLPHRHAHFSLVLQLRASVVEAGQKQIRVNLIDDDGADVIKPIEGQFNIPKSESAAPNIGRFVMEFGNVEFKKYGTYSVRVLIENMEMASSYFRVSPPPSGGPPKPTQT